MSVPDPSWDSASDQISAHSLQDRVEVSCILCLYSVHPSGSAEALSEKSGFFFALSLGLLAPSLTTCCLFRLDHFMRQDQTDRFCLMLLVILVIFVEALLDYSSADTYYMAQAIHHVE